MKKIMLVDDVEISNFILKKLINIVDRNHIVQDFTDPVAAFDKLQDYNPEIIFLDLNMPVLDGFGFLEKMQELNLQNDVFILTSSISQIDKEKALQYPNVKSFLVKPLDVEILSGII